MKHKGFFVVGSLLFVHVFFAARMNHDRASDKRVVKHMVKALQERDRERLSFITQYEIDYRRFTLLQNRVQATIAVYGLRTKARELYRCWKHGSRKFPKRPF